METTQHEQSQIVAAQLPTAADNLQTTTRYDRSELNRIVEYLTRKNGLLDPEYILLFGTLSGGTPHSEALCYDLIVAVRDVHACDWTDVKRGLRQRLPYKHRDITYMNIYVYRIDNIQPAVMPHLYFAHAEGELIYCKERYPFRRPKRACNFSAIYRDTKTYFDTFMPIADLFIKAASVGSPRSTTEIRWSAYSSAQAAKIYYKVLYFVYHNETFDSENPVVMHERMRTLSTDLMLLFDSDNIGRKNTLPYLEKFDSKALSDMSFPINPDNLARYMNEVAHLGAVVRICCEQRLELYKSSVGE